MPHHKSCKKRLKTSEKARLYNRAYKARMRHSIKTFRSLTNAEEASTALPGISSMLDSLAKKGVIPRGTASRLKSRLSLYANRLARV